MKRRSKNRKHNKRNYNHKKVRAGYPYNYKEICLLFNISLWTVNRWRREGLNVIDPHRTPCLVLGKELIRFLKKRKSDRKINLTTGEFNCRRCCAARRSVDNKIMIVMNGIEFSPGNHKADIVGTCEVCKGHLHLFSSERVITKLVNTTRIVLDHEKSIKWSAGSTINASFQGGDHE